ncbi:MAG: hypothetical protein Q8873_05075, partial [Bacillota bacterium]|nr:hypothetical protein [Bacillota bacterium]
AAKRTLSDTTVSILTSAGILTCAGLMLGIISSNKIISQLGILVGRGAVFSCILVLFVLPVLLVMFDTPIQKLTKGLKFYKEEKKK